MVKDEHDVLINGLGEINKHEQANIEGLDNNNDVIIKEKQYVRKTKVVHNKL